MQASRYGCDRALHVEYPLGFDCVGPQMGRRL